VEKIEIKIYGEKRKNRDKDIWGKKEIGVFGEEKGALKTFFCGTGALKTK
jgi:hypothetical protein